MKDSLMPGGEESLAHDGRGEKVRLEIPILDPDARLGYAYVMNKLDFYLEDEPRDLATPLSCSSNGLIGYLWFRLAACDP
jgi:hypothetical protein